MFTMVLAYAKFYGMRYVARTAVRRGMRVVVGLLGSFWLFVVLFLAYLWLSQHGVLPLWSSSLPFLPIRLVLR